MLTCCTPEMVPWAVCNAELTDEVPVIAAWIAVGFDNWEVIAAACRPPLTTVDMNLRELGRTAGEELLSAIEGRPSSGLRRLPCSLVLRESSRPRYSSRAAASAGTSTE